jgi:hypothetical protein
MIKDRPKLSMFLAVLAVGGLFATGSTAEPKLIGIDFLTADQQKTMWSLVDRYASYAVVLKDCAADSHFEDRFVEAARPCIEPNTITRVVDYYHQSAASFDKRFNRSFCSNKKFVENDVAQKIRTALDNLVTIGHNLCVSYLKTGVVAR